MTWCKLSCKLVFFGPIGQGQLLLSTLTSLLSQNAPEGEALDAQGEGNSVVNVRTEWAPWVCLKGLPPEEPLHEDLAFWELEPFSLLEEGGVDSLSMALISFYPCNEQGVFI